MPFLKEYFDNNLSLESNNDYQNVFRFNNTENTNSRDIIYKISQKSFTQNSNYFKRSNDSLLDEDNTPDKKLEIRMSILILILNIFFCGFGTLIKSCFIKNKFNVLLSVGFYQLLLFPFFCFYGLVEIIRHAYKGVILYSFIRASEIYLSSIIIGISSFFDCEPKSNQGKRTKRGIIILVLNLLTGGLGNILSKCLISNKNLCCECTNCFTCIMGPIGLFLWVLFELFLLGLSLINYSPSAQTSKVLCIIGGIGYFFSILFGILLFKKTIYKHNQQ